MKNITNENFEAIKEVHHDLINAICSLAMAGEHSLAHHVKSLMFRNIDHDLAIKVIEALNADQDNPWFITYSIEECECCGDEMLAFDIAPADEADEADEDAVTSDDTLN